MYDVIIVGARCAGATLGALLARKGYHVLMLDKATFPSDTISTHIIVANAVARLRDWGLHDRILSTGCPKINTMTINTETFSLTGTPEPYQEIDYHLAPRRILLDQILIDAAIEHGVEFRPDCALEELVMEHDTVTGVVSRTKSGQRTVERASLIVGADGRNSQVAKLTHADQYHGIEPKTTWYYTYWSGVDVTALSFFMLQDRAIGFIPTNDGLVCMPVIWHHHEFHTYRADVERNYLDTLARVPAISELMQHARREERFLGMAELPSFFRQPFGPGWALVGDAGYHRDPMTGQGISDAFRSAEVLANAIDHGLKGEQEMQMALQTYQMWRDEEMMPMYQLTADWAKLEPPPPEMMGLLHAMEGNPAATRRFFGAITGAIPLGVFFAPDNINQILSAAQPLA